MSRIASRLSPLALTACLAGAVMAADSRTPGSQPRPRSLATILQETEPNNDTSVANPVVLGDTVIATSPGDDTDWFSLELAEGTWVDLRTSSGYFNFQSWHPASLIDTGSRLVIRIGESGKFYAGVHHAGTAEHRVELLPAPATWIYESEAEPNDDLASAIPLSIEDTIAGYFDTPGDVDHFVIDLEQDTWLEFVQDNPGYLSSTMRITLVAPDGEVLLDHLPGDLRVWVPMTGRYHLYTSDYSNAGESRYWPAYVLYTRVSEPEGDWFKETEPNDTPEQAVSLPLGTPVYGRIDPAGDVDYLSVDLVEGMWIQSQVSQHAPFWGQLDLRVVIRAPDGSETSFPYRSQITQSGRYSLSVENRHGTGGGALAYAVSVAEYVVPAGFTQESEPNDSVPNAIVWGDTAVIGTVNPALDFDRFVVSVPAGMRVYFDHYLEPYYPEAPGFRVASGCDGSAPAPHSCFINIGYDHGGPPPGATPWLTYSFKVRYAAFVTFQTAVDHLLDGVGLTEAQEQWLDAAGNADGVYDLGDLRALAQSAGELGSSASGAAPETSP